MPLILEEATKINIGHFNFKKFGFVLEKAHREQLFDKAKSNVGNTWVNLSKQLGIAPSYLFKLRKGQRSINYSLLHKIAEKANVSLSEVEKNVTHIRSGGSFCRISLPILLNENLLGLVAHGFGDGHIISKNFGFRYCNHDNSLIERVHQMVTKAFGEISFYDQLSSHGVPVRTYPFVVGHILHLLGVPKGNKTLQPFTLPQWLIDSNREYKRIFLREIFSDEGGIRSDSGKSNRSISFAQSKWVKYEESLRAFLNEIKEMLNEFGIKSRKVTFQKRYIDKKGREKVVLGFDISKLKNLILFKQEIGFSSPEKMRDLESIIKSFNGYHENEM
jgi:intein/homing endonuclease